MTHNIFEDKRINSKIECFVKFFEKNERKTRGHRQDYTKVEISSIKIKAEKSEKTEKAAK